MAPSDSLRVSAVGDVFLRRDEPARAFEKLQPLFDEADIRFGNCEGVYSTTKERNPCTRALILADPSNASGLAAARFDVMSVANNVTLHAGYSGLFDTMAQLAKHGIQAVGAGEDRAAAHRPVIIERKGLRVGFLAYTSIFIPGIEPGPNKPGYATLKVHTIAEPWFLHPGVVGKVTAVVDPAAMTEMIEDITSLRQQADVVIVSMHWGDLANGPPRIIGYERELGHAAIAAGADVIFGSGPHLLGTVEIHRGRPIFYSLGNSAWDHHPTALELHPEHVLSAVVQCRVSKVGVSEIAVVPAHANAQKQLTPMDPSSKEFAARVAYLQDLTAQAGLRTNFTAEGGRIFVS